MKRGAERNIAGKLDSIHVLLFTLVLSLALLVGTDLVVLFRGSFAAPTGAPASDAPLAVSAQATSMPTLPGMPGCDPTEGGFAQATQSTQPTSVSTSLPDLTPVSTAAPTQDRGVFGLAWFHKPPEDGTAVGEMAKAHSYIHLTGLADIDYRNQLRKAGYTGPIYTYVTAVAVEGPGPYKNSGAACEAGYIPYDNNLAWKPDDFCRYVHPHESWFLHNGKGERLVDDYFGSGHWTYLMNPGDPGWQAFSQERLAFIHDNWDYDGVWLDNVELDLSRGKSDSKNSDGRVREYADDKQWQAAWQAWLAGARGRLGKWPIWANLVGGGLSAESWDAYAPYLDGAMDESFAVSWIDKWRSVDEWKSQLERSDRWLANGKGLVMVGQGVNSDVGRMRFTLASYLLVAQGEESFYRYTRFDSYYSALWEYPEFDTARALGTPVGPRQEIRTGVWTRQFANGSVEVDLNTHRGKLVLK